MGLSWGSRAHGVSMGLELIHGVLMGLQCGSYGASAELVWVSHWALNASHGASVGLLGGGVGLLWGFHWAFMGLTMGMLCHRLMGLLCGFYGLPAWVVWKCLYDGCIGGAPPSGRGLEGGSRVENHSNRGYKASLSPGHGARWECKLERRKVGVCADFCLYLILGRRSMV